MRKKVTFSLIIILTVFYSNAQNIGVELWPSHTFRIKLNKDFKLDIENQLRGDIYSVNLNQFFTQASIKFEIKQAKLTSGFRLIQEFKSGIENHFRYHIDYAYITDFSMSTFTLRIRFQTKNQLGVSKFDGDYYDNDLRYRGKVKFRIPKSKFKPSLSLELFQHFEKGALNGFNKYRINIGGEYKLPNKGKIGLTINREKQWVYWNPKTTWIFMPYYVTYIKKKEPKEEPFNQFD